MPRKCKCGAMMNLTDSRGLGARYECSRRDCDNVVSLGDRDLSDQEIDRLRDAMKAAMEKQLRLQRRLDGFADESEPVALGSVLAEVLAVRRVARPEDLPVLKRMRRGT